MVSIGYLYTYTDEFIRKVSPMIIDSNLLNKNKW
nr:MAG TPA: hypothetical protein [Caudoviricetes sp.]